MTPLREGGFVIVGGGVVGTATALELARHGHRVHLFERFPMGHTRGSSHGPTRIFRLSYPDPVYVELALEALQDWSRLERDSKETLVQTTGGLDFGYGAELCAEAMEAAGVEFDEITSEDARSRFGLELTGRPPIIFQQQTGVIAAGRTVEVQILLARHAGATIDHEVMVTDIDHQEDSVIVRTTRGDVTADVVVIAAGPWTAGIAANVGIELPLFVTREQVAYLEPAMQLPVLIEWTPPAHYLVPAMHGAKGLRVGLHHHGEPVDPDAGPFEPIEAGIEEAVKWVAKLTGTEPRVVAAEVCLYTNAPDEDFIIERHGRIVVVSACSGHGFKFAPRTGRAVANLAMNLDPGLPGRLGDWWRAAG